MESGDAIALTHQTHPAHRAGETGDASTTATGERTPDVAAEGALRNAPEMDVTSGAVHAFTDHDAGLRTEGGGGGAGELCRDHHITVILPAIERALTVHASTAANGVSAATDSESARRRCSCAEVFRDQSGAAGRGCKGHVVKGSGAQHACRAAIARGGETDLGERVRHGDRGRGADGIPCAR